MAHFAGPILDRVDLFLAADGNAVRVAPAPRAPPQRPSAVPRIRCATVRAAAPCVLAARGAPTPVPAARASRRWAPGLSIARAASRSRCTRRLSAPHHRHTSPSADVRFAPHPLTAPRRTPPRVSQGGRRAGAYLFRTRDSGGRRPAQSGPTNNPRTRDARWARRISACISPGSNTGGPASPSCT